MMTLPSCFLLLLSVAMMLFDPTQAARHNHHHHRSHGGWRMGVVDRLVGGAAAAAAATASSSSATSLDNDDEKPKWLQMKPETLDEYMELAKQRHQDAVQKAQESYYSYSTTDAADNNSNTDNDGDDASLTPSELPSVRTLGIDAPPTWSLPDFSNEFDMSKLIFVTQTPLFTTEECNQVIQNAEEHFAASTTNGSWTTLPSGQYNVAGFWIKSVPAVHRWFNHAVRTKLFPLLANQFPHFCKPEDLVVDNAYLFKYTTETGRRTDVHTDSGCLSFTIALNEVDDYRGGGTWFEALTSSSTTATTDTTVNNKNTAAVVEMEQGVVTVRPGGIRHCGQAVTDGTRYIIGGFCMHRQKVEPVRMLIGLGAERALQDDYSGAEEAYVAALVLNSKFDAAYANLASVLEKQGKTQQAMEALEYCHYHVNPQNAEVAYSLGIMYLDRATASHDDELLERCKSCMEICLASDDCDADAMVCMAQACQKQGDGRREEEWLRRIVQTQDVTNETAATAYCNLGVLKQGSDEEIDLYEKGLELSPYHFELRYSLGSALATQGDFPRAVEHFRVIAETTTDATAQTKALQVLYKAAVNWVQQESQTKGAPSSREAMVERLRTIMGIENYNRLAASATRRQ